ncbi:phage integrase SAM-like domain-containing protein [Porphyromonas gulae]|uniref:phage integrase SAM-like domain-containing protein n=1 Tax=Porphyromonas gulae TaxID=111105 RepID=UPI0009B8FCA9|nr:phage integrase SAM-like domain-containing protein [Porphyromonas gulae]
MQTDKFKVLLYLKKSGLDKSGQAPIMGRITYGRTMAQFSCKLSCNPKLWNTRESRLNGKSRKAVVTNDKLERLLLSVQSSYQILCNRGAVFTASDIKEQFQGSMQTRITFLERYDRMVKEMEQKVDVEIKATTLNSYYTTRKHLQAFICEKYHTTDIPFGQIEEEFLECLQLYSVGKLGHSQGYYRKTALAVKKVCRLAYREGLTERQLFAHVEIERGENKQPRALDRSSLDKLHDLTFEPYEVELETARNLFLFSCFTGVAYCDLVALNRDHLFTDDEGDLWLKFRRQKTNTLCRVKLLSEAVRLIERYQSDERSTLFAPIAYSAYLIQLKALQLRAGISIPLSAHMAKHREIRKYQITSRLV